MRNNEIFMSLIVATVLTVLSYSVGMHMGWSGSVDTFTWVNWLEAFSVFTSYSCTYLCVMQSRFNYIIGGVSVVALSVIFYQYALYSSMILNIYLIPTLIYGWYRWGHDDNTRPVTSLLNDRWYVIGGYAFIALAAWGVVYNTTLFMGATLPGLDVSILVLSVLAQFLLDNKRIETWFVWAVVNVIAMYVYFNAGLFLIFFQYIFFMANTVYGYYMWSKTHTIKKEMDFNYAT